MTSHPEALGQNPPTVALIKPFTPTPESTRGDMLEYGSQITDALAKHTPHQAARWERYLGAEPNTLVDRTAREQLLAYNVLAMAGLQTTAETPAAADLYATRFTHATTSLFGSPDAAVAKELFGSQASSVLVGSSKLAQAEDSYSKYCEKVGVSFTSEATAAEKPFQRAAAELGDYVRSTYANVFDALLDNAPVDALIEPAGIADRFERGVGVLRQEFDEAWGELKVVRDEKRNQLSVAANKNTVLVGMKRAAVTTGELEALFAHEILIHAGSAINGRKLSPKLGTGLPGYLDTEEGQGVFLEYALTGTIPEKNIDRYVDVALALGEIGLRPHARPELLEFVRSRAALRAEQMGVAVSAEHLNEKVYPHVNRLYRGTTGDRHIGVFTKDIAYHRGFMSVGAYITRELEAGAPIHDVFATMTAGKFNPEDALHREFIAEQRSAAD